MNFTVYSKKGCPYCTKILSVLNQLSISKGFSVREYTLGSEFNREQFYAEFGEGSTFPQVLFETQKLGGCSDTIKYLKEQNMI
jgi:glutaredoxin 3